MQQDLDPGADLVDYFYYDYILSKLIHLYCSGGDESQFRPYLQIVTLYSRIIHTIERQMDYEMCFKEIYLLVIQMFHRNEHKNAESIIRLAGSARTILRHCETPEIEDPEKTILCVIGICYLRAMSVASIASTTNENSVNSADGDGKPTHDKDIEYIMSLVNISEPLQDITIIRLCEISKITIDREIGFFENLKRHLLKIKFKKTPLLKFCDFVAGQIDKETES